MQSVALVIYAFPAMGLGLLWIVNLLDQKQRMPEERGVVGTVLTVLGWFAIVIGLAVPMAASCIGVCLLLFLAMTLVMALVAYNANEQRALLSMLALSAEHQLPLSEAARAFAADRTDHLGRKARRLARLLDEGMPLADAFAKSGNRLPVDVEITLRIESKAGDSGSLLNATDAGHRRQRLWRSLFEQSFYFVLLLLMVQPIIFFMMIKIVPSYAQIFSDFDTELPGLTRLIITASGIFAKYSFMFIVWVPLLFFACAIGAGYYTRLLRWEPFGIRWLTRRYHRSCVLATLSCAVDAGRPIASALTSLGQWYPQPTIRGKLRMAAEQVARGQSWCESLQACRLLDTRETAVLQAAQRVSNLPWALNEMAARNDQSIENRLGLIKDVGYPLLLLTFAIPIALIVIGLFIPFISLTLNLG